MRSGSAEEGGRGFIRLEDMTTSNLLVHSAGKSNHIVVKKDICVETDVLNG